MSDHVNLNTAAIERNLQQQMSRENAAQQVASQESLDSLCEEIINPWAASQADKERFQKSLQERKTHFANAIQKAKGEIAEGSTPLEQAAAQFEAAHPELNARSLVNAFLALSDKDSDAQLLQQLQEAFPDVTLTDDALEFCLQHAKSPLLEKLQAAKSRLEKQFTRQIAAGRNVSHEAQTFAQKGIGSPTALRELYRDITGNPREATPLFTELSQKYNFGQLKAVIQFLLHALGSDLRSKGPSIQPAELTRLFTEARTLQAIFGVYRFFQSRMSLLGKMFAAHNQHVPSAITFESMARAFMKLLDDRFPNASKARQSALQMGLRDELECLIAVISQWRDAVHNVSVRLYRSIAHRDELLNSIIACLEELEDEADEEEDTPKKDNPKDGG